MHRKLIHPIPAEIRAQMVFQLILERAVVDNADAAFKAGITATVQYTSILHAAKPARFTLIGFTKAFRPLPQATPSARKKSAQSVNSISGIEPAIIYTNNISVSAGDLRKRANPFGIRSFVFVPKTRYAGVERLFIWFVRDDEAVKLNGATHNLNPSLPFPNDTAPPRQTLSF